MRASSGALPWRARLAAPSPRGRFGGVSTNTWLSAAVEREPIHVLEPRDLRQRLRPERRLPLECVQHDALEEIAEGEVEILRESLQDLERALLDPQPGLHPFDRNDHWG